MKTLLLPLVALCAFFAPVHLAEAKAKAPKPPAVFGDWTVGKTFTLRVANVISTTQATGGSPQAVPVPKGMPAYTVGELVTFTIAKNGALTAPKGVNIPFTNGSLTANIYTGKVSRKGPPPLATINKNTTTTEPIGGSMQFVQMKLVKRIPSITTVWYTFAAP